MPTTYATYEEYWNAYLNGHSKPATRICHYLGTCVGLVLGVAAIVTLQPLLLLAGVIGCYAMAFASHFLIEHNRPMAHRPVWGAVSDLRMCALALTGRLHAELKVHARPAEQPVTEGE